MTNDLLIVIKLAGLQHRKYLIQFSEEPCSERLKCSWTYEAEGVSFERRSIQDQRRTGGKLVPVVSECYKLMFDQDTNLLHSITYL